MHFPRVHICTLVYTNDWPCLYILHSIQQSFSPQSLKFSTDGPTAVCNRSTWLTVQQTSLLWPNEGGSRRLHCNLSSVQILMGHWLPTMYSLVIVGLLLNSLGYQIQAVRKLDKDIGKLKEILTCAARSFHVPYSINYRCTWVGTYMYYDFHNH